MQTMQAIVYLTATYFSLAPESPELKLFNEVNHHPHRPHHPQMGSR